MLDEKELNEIATFSIEIQNRIKFISDMFPISVENKEILKHLAASSIHLTFFVRDLFDMVSGTTSQKDEELEKQFLEKCGCDK